ncbi:ribosome assembly RNA-binding protein YhbY [Umboniibacter marinipuniceus]|uniref:RNA-binding protein n=1 Tax=Umboniibacter marinipuniceus TaxID=569599 RepID=A0A3M0AMA4_9GAMM|nr:ribosome assembly RNA-binding protein YhbY [Umboniibacter marinipuniceus]RMA80102.1 RNA-binding protein [Umboniibacter marinipuniceus]
MTLTQQRKKQLRAIGHNLKPVVMISENGLTEGVLNELNRALNDHELIKVKLAIPERIDRAEVASAVVAETNSTLVQTIGKIILICREARKPNPKLSNLLR